MIVAAAKIGLLLLVVFAFYQMWRFDTVRFHLDEFRQDD